MGRNYRAHAAEMGNEVPDAPLLFLKPTSSLIGTGTPIVLPSISTEVEFEGEIGLLLGRDLRNATPDEACAAIRAVLPVNDVTARDLQKSDGQWARAKGCDTFCPVGPPVAVDGLPGGLDRLAVRSFLNGVQTQEGDVGQMVFGFGEVLAYASRAMTLEAGDLISTGTPHGVAPLLPGAVIRVELGRRSDEGEFIPLSMVENPVVGAGDSA